MSCGQVAMSRVTAFSSPAPPGNGKTSFAEAIAEGLGLPFYVVRYDALIGSYLGETNARLRKLFDYVRTTPSVLFFDEFDAIGKERGDTHETGEIKRVVSFLLMQLGISNPSGAAGRQDTGPR